MKYFKLPIILSSIFLLTAAGFQDLLAQERLEPDLAEMEDPLSPYDYDIKNGIAFNMQLNNHGFAIGGEYRRVLSRYTKGSIELYLGNIKDQGEQTFQNIWGYSVIPNKYNRVLSMPVIFGVGRRLFANDLADNFRLFAKFAGGPSLAFVYPYFDHEMFDYGFRLPDQPHYDPFQGWGDGEFIFGGAGHISLGAHIGGDFGNIQTIRIGFFFHYYPAGIQIMEPKEPGPGFQFAPVDQLGPDALVPASDKQYFFGSPHITFVFGSMW